MSDSGGELGLPPLFRLRGYPGTLGEYVNALYWTYEAMTGHAGIRLWGRPVLGCDEEAADGRPAQFWHVITDGPDVSGARRLDLERCELLPRARPAPGTCGWSAAPCRR